MFLISYVTEGTEPDPFMFPRQSSHDSFYIFFTL